MIACAFAALLKFGNGQWCAKLDKEHLQIYWLWEWIFVNELENKYTNDESMDFKCLQDAQVLILYIRGTIATTFEWDKKYQREWNEQKPPD